LSNKETNNCFCNVHSETNFTVGREIDTRTNFTVGREIDTRTNFTVGREIEIPNGIKNKYEFIYNITHVFSSFG
jgi:hypothetical protein